MRLQTGELPPRKKTKCDLFFRLKPVSDETGKLRYTIVKLYNPKTDKFDIEADEKTLQYLNKNPDYASYRPFRAWVD